MPYSFTDGTATFNLGVTVSRCRRSAEFGSFDINGYATVRKNTSIPVAGGETLTTVGGRNSIVVEVRPLVLGGASPEKSASHQKRWGRDSSPKCLSACADRMIHRGSAPADQLWAAPQAGCRR